MSHRKAPIPTPAERHLPPTPDAHQLAALPLLASTHFCMEVLLRGAVLDLRSASEVLTFDPCALLRLFALVAEEFPVLQDRPQRLDECIIALGRSGLARALFHTRSNWAEQARLSAFAEHAVTIARCAQVAAVTLGFCEETAYLVGIFHDIGALPAELGWALPPSPPEAILQTTIALADLYQLPPVLRAALISLAAQQESTIWFTLIEAAHQLAEGNTPAPSTL